MHFVLQLSIQLYSYIHIFTTPPQLRYTAVSEVGYATAFTLNYGVFRLSSEALQAFKPTTTVHQRASEESMHYFQLIYHCFY